MEHAASKVQTHARAGRPAAFIAADVGGTYARVGLVESAAARDGRLALHRYQTFRCADYPGLGAILREFLDSLGDITVREGAIASAGYPLGEQVIHTNLPWPVAIEQIRAELGLHDLALINDFAAIAHGVRHVQAQDVTLLSRAAQPASAGPIVVLGPGTGLGAAVLIPGSPPTVLTTEAGQAAFAASTETELRILGVLRRQFDHVSNERMLSGPGLANIYGALLDGAPAPRTPEEITTAALQGADPVALQALQVFCGLMGSVAGDLALYYGAHGGVYLAGGILPRIKQFLLGSSFMERFLNKGRLAALLERVPVKLIEHGQLGVLGAASWYLDTHREPG